jgi:tetratricopeptide (TPR) repeat protein
VATTRDGRLWVHRAGLWTEDGDGWRELKPDGVATDSAYWISAGQDRVWLWDWCNYAIVAITKDGKVAARFTMADLGLRRDTRIGTITAAGDRTWFATGAGLLLFEDGKWQNVGHPERSVAMWQAEAAPDGSVWVVAHRASLARVAAWVGPPFAFFEFSLIGIGLLIAMWIHGGLENRMAAQTAAGGDAAAPLGADLTADQARVARQGRALMWIVPMFMAGVPIAWFGLERIGLAGARIPGPIILGCAALAAFWWISKDDRPSSTANLGWLRDVVTAGAVIAWLRYARFDWLDQLAPVPVLGPILRLAIAILGITLIIGWRSILGTGLAKSAWNKSDYDGALRNLRRLHFGAPNFKLLDLEGLTLALANRHAEAEEVFRRALKEGRWAAAAERSSVLACLGQMLDDQGRYEEAVRCLEASIRMSDPRGGHRMTLAESYLKQGIEPQKALDLIDAGMRIPKPQIRAQLEPGRLASRAWALAQLGRKTEAEETIARVRPVEFPAMRSFTHLQLGMALLALEQPQKAADHFRSAIAADPKGSSAAKAVEQLKLCVA